MSENPDGLVKLSGGDVHLWVEAESSVMLKAITKHGDPVDLTSDEAKELAETLVKMAAKIE